MIHMTDHNPNSVNGQTL